MEFEQLINGTLLFDQLLLKLPLRTILSLPLVCSLFRDALNRDSLWRQIANELFRDKTFVPAVCVRMLRLESETEYPWCLPHLKKQQENQAASASTNLSSSSSATARYSNSKETRLDLNALSVRELRLLCTAYRLDMRTCCERQDLVALVNRFEITKSFEGECLMKFAVRIAWLDRTRNALTLDELINLSWHIRTRSTGPLAALANMDPWWLGEGCGKANFDRAGEVTFDFPPHCNPFQHIRFRNQQDHDDNPPKLAYELAFLGTIVHLTHIHVHERVARHPENWGWILVSLGTVWTGWEMPRIGTDDFLDDVVVDKLVRPAHDGGYTLSPNNRADDYDSDDDYH